MPSAIHITGSTLSGMRPNVGFNQSRLYTMPYGKQKDSTVLSAEGIRYITHRDRAQLPTTRGIWSTALTTDRQERRRHVGHRIETWARQTKHADGITWFLSKLEAEARVDPDSEPAVVGAHRQV